MDTMHLFRSCLIVLLGFSRYVLPARPATEQHVISPPGPGYILSIHDALKYSSIISDVLDDFQPTHSVSIAYPKAHESLQLGNDIPVESVSCRPVFEFHSMLAGSGTSGTSNKTLTLVLTDPDAKSRDNPKWSEMCHWILTNLTTTMTSDTTIAEKSELVEYLPPKPPPKTGKHRYVFVLLEGQQGQPLSTPSDRKHWGFGKVRHGVRDWAKENELKVVGANFFYAADQKQ